MSLCAPHTCGSPGRVEDHLDVELQAVVNPCSLQEQLVPAPNFAF